MLQVVTLFYDYVPVNKTIVRSLVSLDAHLLQMSQVDDKWPTFLTKE